jgi:hypothetical protein
LSLGLHERVGLALLELCSDFGIPDSRGTLLRVAVSHNHLANLVGASRPRVTEHLALLERDGLVIRQGHQLVVCADELKASINTRIPDLPVKLQKSFFSPANPAHERNAAGRSSRDETVALNSILRKGQCALT